MADKNELFGMKQIQTCCARLGLPSSEASIISMIQLDGLPAKKIGGRWISNTVSIENWRIGFIEGRRNSEKTDINKKRRSVRK